MKIGDTGTWTDPRDGQVYPTKVMKDGATWMTKNYNFKTADSVCYNNDPSKGANYGRLYHWKDATNNLPEGWHIPNMDEWNNLVFKYSDQPLDFAAFFKGETDRQGGNYGFNAIKGGIWRKENNGFVWIDDYCGYLCSTLGMTYTEGNKQCHYIAGLTNVLSCGTGTPDDEYKASCRLIISGY